MIQLNKDKSIVLTSPHSVLEIHRYLQSFMDNSIRRGDDMLDITAANPSRRVIDSAIQLLDNWHIDKNSICFINEGAWEDCNGSFSRVTLLGCNDNNKNYKVISNGEVIRGGFDQRGYPGYYIKNGTKVKITGTPSFKMDIEKGMAHSYVAVIPNLPSLATILKEL